MILLTTVFVKLPPTLFLFAATKTVTLELLPGNYQVLHPARKEIILSEPFTVNSMTHDLL